MTTQAIVTPSMIPAPVAQPDILYIPQLLFGKILYFPEMEVGRTREAELVADMLDAQIVDVVKIIAIDEASGDCWNATTEIASAIFTHLIRTGSNIPEWLVDFLEANIPMSELAPYLNQLAA